MPDEKVLCKNCEYFVRYDKDHGRCHFYPPQASPDGNFRFPLVKNGEWCQQGKESGTAEANK